MRWLLAAGVVAASVAAPAWAAPTSAQPAPAATPPPAATPSAPTATPTAPATAAPSTAPAGKKQQLLADKARARATPAAARAAERARWQRQLRRRIGRRPPGMVNVYNTWTHEFIAVEAGAGKPALPAKQLSRFLRCHFTNHRKPMAGALFGVLISAANHFRVDRVNIVSGYRAPKYNLMLRKKGRRVARNSEHTFGHAVDFRLPGVTTEKLRDWARRLRLGGVGYYKGDRFVHVDTGPVRYWAE